MMKRLLGLTALLLLLSNAVAQSPTGDAVEAARAFRTEHGAKILADFVSLLALPNVGSDAVNIRQNADFIQTAFERRGIQIEQWKVPGAPPLIYGSLTIPGASRTLGIYVHYDGQPADPSNWTHNPWEPTLYTASMEAGGRPRPLPQAGEIIDPEWRLYARSAGDDKAPLAALLAAFDALQQAAIPVTSNLKFMFEGEEEMGSGHLPAYLERYRDSFDDVETWLFCDGPVHQSRRAQLVFGVRGVTGLEVTVYGATRSLHSGHYGNWAPVPGQRMANLLASMKADDGRILIDGFYDTVAPIGTVEEQALAALPDYDAVLREQMGLVETEEDNAVLKKRLLLPSLTIKGFNSGNVGALARNVIPATATAALGIRLVKGNDPNAMIDLVEAHIRKQGYHIVREDPDLETRLAYPKIAKVTREGGYPAARTAMNLPIVPHLVEAITQASGTEPYLIPALGGSLPLYLFTDFLGQPAIITPIANHDNNQHAPDENLRLANLWYGIDLYAALLTMPR